MSRDFWWFLFYLYESNWTIKAPNKQSKKVLQRFRLREGVIQCGPKFFEKLANKILIKHVGMLLCSLPKNLFLLHILFKVKPAKANLPWYVRERKINGSVLFYNFVFYTFVFYNSKFIISLFIRFYNSKFWIIKNEPYKKWTYKK